MLGNDVILTIIISALVGPAMSLLLNHYLSKKKVIAEIGEDSATAAEASAHAVQMYAEELANVRKELGTLRKEVDDLQLIIAEQRSSIADLKDWADRLSHQVHSLGGVPVPFRQTKK